MYNEFWNKNNYIIKKEFESKPAYNKKLSENSNKIF